MAYTKEVYDLALSEMEKRRTKAEQELEKRREKFYAVCPAAQKNEEEIVKISVAAGRAVLSGSDIREELSSLRDRSLVLQGQLSDMLEKNGFSQNWLEEWYECKLCGDKGYIDGRMCSCMKNLLKKISYDQLNMISPLSLSGFDSFSTSYYSDKPLSPGKRSPREIMTKVENYCRRYAENFSDESNSLIFQGDSGLGKTHLSLAIAQTVIEKGYGVIYVSAPAVFSKIEQEHFSAYSENRGDTERLLTECDLLILDDLGSEFNSKYTASAIYNIINIRILSHRPTIISTNLTIPEIEKQYGSRLVSRVIGMLDRVEFVGTDIRQIKRRERKNNK